MLRLVDKNDFTAVSEFCRRDSFGTRIAAQLTAYGDYPSALFYVGETNGKISAAISSIDGDAAVCVGDEADRDEILSLTRVIGCKRVLSRPPGFGEKLLSGRVMAISGVDSVTAELFEPQSAEDFKGLFELLCACGHAEEKNFAPWYADISHRIRHGVTEFFIVRKDRKPISCAAVLFESEFSKFLGAVSTLPELRGRGFARECVLSAASGMKPCALNCKEALVGFYQKLGFAPKDEWIITGDNK